MVSSVNDVQTRIAEVVFQKVPKEAEVCRIEFEGPRVAIYTMKPEVLVDQSYILTAIVNLIKKRIVLRSDPSVRKPEREANQIIMGLVAKDAEITNINFDPTIGEVIIEAKKPGLVIGKNGSALHDIVKQTRWRPRVLRSPPIPSKIIANIRHYLYQESRNRERILRTIGERIFRQQVMTGNEVYLTPLGGCKEVGRSAILIQTNESRILLDCGINPGTTAALKAFPRFDADSFNLELLDAVIVSHAHLDHCGFLPFLFKYGYDGPVYCSEPTASLMTLLQLDYLDVVQKRGKKPPYDQRAVRDTLVHTLPIKNGTVTDISPDVKLTIHNSGHILGSTLVHLHVGEGLHNIVYTSDFKYGRTMLLEPAETNFPRVETLIIESTYGAPRDIMPSRKEAESRLVSWINSALVKGGKALIPVPAVGRAQEIMLVIDGYMKHGLIKEAPVYIEGMVNEATAIHTAYPEYLARDIRDQIFREGINPFQSEYFVKVKDTSIRQEIIQGGPCIVLATSGMLEGGPSVEYFKELAGDERNTLIFVSYQIEGTLGRRLQRKVSEAQMLTAEGKIEIVQINLRTATVAGFSGHSDRNQIMNYLRRISPKPNRIVVNHGERTKCLGLAKSLRKAFGVETRVPGILETIKLK